MPNIKKEYKYFKETIHASYRVNLGSPILQKPRNYCRTRSEPGSHSYHGTDKSHSNLDGGKNPMRIIYLQFKY